MKGLKFQEYYNQAQLFYNSLTDYERQHIIGAISFELDHCDDPTVYKNAIPRLNEIDHELAKQVALNVGGPLPLAPNRANHGRKAKGLSQTEFNTSTPTIKSRRIAIIVADGFDLSVVEGIKALIKAGGALPFVIGPRRGEIYPAGKTVGKDSGMMADHHFEGMRSTLFDALFIPGGVEHAKTLMDNGRVKQWILEAFGHLKIIGAVGEG